MSQPITELVFIRISAKPWGVEQKEERFAVKESAKMVHGSGVRIYKEEIGRIKRGYVGDSVFGVERRGYCRPEDVDQMRDDVLVDIRETIADLQRNLDMMKTELERTHPSPKREYGEESS